jgi:serine/threonine-protein kinase
MAPQSSSGWLSSSDSISHGRFAPGVVLDNRYRIIGMLGKGGMGEVYRADDLRLGQPVALKFLPESLHHDSQRLAQFHNEVRTAREVSHANVCRVHDIGEVEGLLYLSMEYVDGEDLSSSLRRIGRFPEDKASEIARQICAGLAAAHQKGVVHRDLKPANVMLDGQGRVRLMDFGLASVGGAKDIRAGTPGYMAPEQLRGTEVTPRSDIWALGLVMYELFTGRRAFTATTIDELMAQQDSRSFTPPSTLVTNLDESIDRAITRCLEPDPGRRPQSALAVSAALPGGDPLAAALAAGETPSPEMVAAAGEGAGLKPVVAWSLLIATAVGLVASLMFALKTGPFDTLPTDLTPDVLTQKARDAITQIGYDTRPRDEAVGFRLDVPLVEYVSKNDKPSANWNQILTERPSILTFWYRRSDEALWSTEFHTDLLTPGIVDQVDPSETTSGMMVVELDHAGRLQHFVAIPAQRLDAPAVAAAVDWAPLFQLAGLDLSKFQTTDPLWTYLAASDTRVAWTGAWPDSGRPLRIEAAAFGGKPVAFTLLGPWRQPWRMPEQALDSSTSTLQFWLLLIIAAFTIGAAGVLARRNIHDGRGDRKGAAKLGGATAVTLMLLWVCRQHAVADFSVAAQFFVAMATATAYGVLMWTIYLALEPFVRRYWPQVLVSWTSLLTGHARDAVVGRDVLIGVAMGVFFSILFRLVAMQVPEAKVAFAGSMDVMTSFRGTIGEVFQEGFYAFRNVLFYFFLLFVLRVILRRPLLAVIAFTAFFTAFNMLSNTNPYVGAALGLLYFGTASIVIWRWGLLSMAVGSLVSSLLFDMVVSTNLSAWYVSNSALLLAVVVGLAGWSFYSAIGRSLKAA